jgi:hypothetical protein
VTFLWRAFLPLLFDNFWISNRREVGQQEEISAIGPRAHWAPRGGYDETKRDIVDSTDYELQVGTRCKQRSDM